MKWGEDSAPGPGLDDLVTELLGADEVASISAYLAAGHVENRLGELRRHLADHHLFDRTPDELDLLAIQQAQWEATAYRSAEQIMARARQRAVEADASGTRSPARTEIDRPVYRGRHEAAGRPADQPLSIETRRNLRAVRGRGNFRRQLCDGSDRMLVEVNPDALEQLRPQHWEEVLRVVQKEAPADRATMYQMADEAFEWANRHRDTLPSEPELVGDWIRRCVLQALHERTATASRDQQFRWAS